MVGEVVIHGNTIDDAAHLHAPLDVLESAQRLRGLRHRHADVARGGDGGQRVGAVVLAGQRPAHGAGRLAVEDDVEAAVVVLGHGPVDAIGAAEVFVLAPAAARNHALQGRLVAVDDEPAYAGHGAHQMVELGLDRAQIGEDVGVIVFEVVEDGGLGVIVDELAALSKKAVPYSSASMTKKAESALWPSRWPDRRAETPKFIGTPPIRKPGA